MIAAPRDGAPSNVSDGVLADLLEDFTNKRQQGEAVDLEAFARAHPEHADRLQRLLPVLAAVADLGLSAGADARSSEFAFFPAPPGAGPLGDYQLVREIGRGGMGIVYQARQVSLKRLVALKVVLAGAHAGPSELARFRLEAEAAAGLQHPNIVQIHEIGEQEGRPYFSLEYVEGGSLAHKLAGSPLPARQAAELVETLARAVHFAHQRGIIHRDLKPANILLTAEGIPKVTDFGLAKRLDTDAGQTQTGAIVGTASYMAPEQAGGLSKAIGPLADVYGLGATLYELLTGRPPFRAETPLDTLQQVQHEEPVPPSRLQPKVPRDLETICLKCLEKQPQRRYAGAEALADDLRRFLGGESIQARRVGACERALKWVRRRPAAAAVWAVSGAAVLALLAVSVWFNAKLGAALGQTKSAWARSEAQQARERERLSAVRKDGQVLVFEGQGAVSREDWQQARLQLSQALARLGAEPSLADLKEQAERLLAQADRRLGEQAVRQEAQARYRKFTQRRDDALFHRTLFTGLNLPENLEATRADATEALALFGLSGSTDKGLLPDPRFSAEEQAEITAGCYELLLVLAELEARALPGQKAEERRLAIEKALRFLDRAAGLGSPTRAYHLRRARYLAELGDEGGARKERQWAEAQQAASPLDHFLVGEEWHKQDKLTEAVSEFENVLRLQPDHFWGQYYLAICQLKLQRWGEARANLTACLARRPAFIWIYLLRGFANGESGAFTAAEDDFQKALQLRPDEAAQYGIYVNRGVMRIRQGKLADAVADLQQAIALKPHQYQAYANLAQAYQAQEQFDQAIAQLDRAIALAPTQASLYRLRAGLALKQRDSKGALRDLEEAIRVAGAAGMSSALAQDHAQRGRILQQDHQYGDALTAYEVALTIHPQDAGALLGRAEVLLKLQRHADAVTAFDRYLANGKPSAAVYRDRALARAQLGNYAGAIDDYSRALDRVPDLAMRAARGWAYLACEAPKLAGADFEEVIQHDPANSDAYNGRGFARLRLGDLAGALTDAAEALRRGPATPRLLCGTARIFAQAAGGLPAAVGRPDRSAMELRASYQGRALELLRQALEGLAPTKRAAFWRDAIEADAALNPLRGHPRFAVLKEEATTTAK